MNLYIEKFISDNTDLKNIDDLVDEFVKELQNLSINELTDIILSDIYIPDNYKYNSSEEKVFTKLVEVLTSFVFEKIGIKSEYLKTKSGTEDIHLELLDDTNQILHIVGDVKTYRLSRSQKAANVKDFVKPADFSEIWGSKYDNSSGLVIFPSTHEWKGSSDVYQHCTNPRYPIVMMHYSHLAILLNYNNQRCPNTPLSSLWDYSDLTNDQINQKSKENYWDLFNKKFNKLFLVDTLSLAEKFEFKIRDTIYQIIDSYEEQKKENFLEIEREIEQLNIDELKDIARKFKIEKELERIDRNIERIKKFRLS